MTTSTGISTSISTAAARGGRKGELLWRLEDLPPLLVGDNLAFKAENIQVPVVKMIGAETWHWAMVGNRVEWMRVIGHLHQLNNPIHLTNPERRALNFDYQVVDSTDKGITHHLLSEYQRRHMRIYRPKYPPSGQEQLAPFFIYLYLRYGTRRYDRAGVASVGLWCILRKMGIKVAWWDHSSKTFWCLEFNGKIHRLCGLPLVPRDEPAHPGNMERSENLELIWRTF